MNERASVLPTHQDAIGLADLGATRTSVAAIGVSCRPSEQAAAKEFFELFKTPWEFFEPGRAYDIVLSTMGDHQAGREKLTLVFNSDATPLDAETGVLLGSKVRTALLSCEGDRIPLYGPWAKLSGGKSIVASDETTGHVAIVAWESKGAVFVRASYDLFEEVRILLTEGQPVRNAEFPTIDLHIALIRDLILNSSLPLVEIPAVPDGFNLTACLTHDVDHPSIRLHKFDHTTAGFLYRATIGSLINLTKGRTTFSKLAKNLWAALTLPFVHLRLVGDTWLKFERYLQIEHGLGSTYFIIPFRDRPGRELPGMKPQEMRAAKYGVDDIAGQVRKFSAAGCEIGLHGIDAWNDTAKAREETAQILRVSGGREIGVRMHWLYFEPNSPTILEQAGFSYDSTVGFNETVGYRSGTIQPYMPLGVSKLLELPLHIMDTALFYPSYLNLTEPRATEIVNRMAGHAARHGGVLMINWHDRSIVPERLWDEFYVQFINELKHMETWFPTANQAASWFRQRRKIVFELVERSGNAIHVKTTGETRRHSAPGLRLRLHRPRMNFLTAGKPLLRSGAYSDSSFQGEFDAKLEV